MQLASCFVVFETSSNIIYKYNKQLQEIERKVGMEYQKEDKQG